jgi:hypothetical protein
VICGRIFRPEPETAQGLLNDLKRDEEKEMIMDDLKTQLDVATPTIIANFRQVFISDCRAYHCQVGYYISTTRTLDGNMRHYKIRALQTASSTHIILPARRKLRI